MTNQQVAELAREKGYGAKVGNGFNFKGGVSRRVLIRLQNRGVGLMEVEAMFPEMAMQKHPTCGVLVYGSDS